MTEIEEVNEITADQLRELILNVRKPVVLRGFQTGWACFERTLLEWCETFDGENTVGKTFEKMPRAGSTSPQWERKRSPEVLTAQEFLAKEANPDDSWYALNYKDTRELHAECCNGIDFGCFGFPDMKKDCRVWLSGKGANTPCHYDTYGCNIVVQVYGSKSWLLFPPEAPLTPTRIPYEQTSVYARENFYSPNPRDVERLMGLKDYAHRCVLQAGDVLIVPRHWWHYAEAMETSLSVNAWVNLNNDSAALFDESIVYFIIDKIMTAQPLAARLYALNPNKSLSDVPDSTIFNIMKHLHDTELSSSAPAQSTFPERYVYQDLTVAQLEEKIRAIPYAHQLENMPNDEFRSFLNAQGERWTETSEAETTGSFYPNMELMVNSICHPDIVRHIRNMWIRQNEVLKSFDHNNSPNV